MVQLAPPQEALGIPSPRRAYPETEKHLNGLALSLLREPSALTPAEREVIAAWVSPAHPSRFAMDSHSDKLKALLVIATKVQQGDRRITGEDIARARNSGADDMAIHDTVLIAAAHWMFHLYVDGLAAWTSRAGDVCVNKHPVAVETLSDGLLLGTED